MPIRRRDDDQIFDEPTQPVGESDGTNLTYRNGEVVIETVDIGSGAEIQLDKTSLRFPAFCPREFDWPDIND